MRNHTDSRRRPAPAAFCLILALLAVASLVASSPSAAAPAQAAQGGATRPRPSYKFTVKDGPRRTAVKVMVARGRITGVSGTNAQGTFQFKRLKAGARPSITGRTGQTSKCAGLKADGGLRWTFCFFVDGGSGPGTEASDYLFEIDSVKGESHDDDGGGWGGGGGGGGGGTPSNCWEDEKLQMSICDP